MANTKITELTALATAALTDVLAIVDLGTTTTKKVTLAVLRAAIMPIVNADIQAAAAIAVTKLAAGTANHVLKTNSAGTANEHGLLVNANIDAAAAVAVSKLAAGTNSHVLTTTAGVPGWAANAAASSGSSGQVQTSDGASGFSAPANVLAGSSFISFHASPANVGAIRLGGSAAATQIGWSPDGVAHRSLLATESGGNGLVYGNQTDAMNIWGANCSLYAASGPSFLYGAGVEALRLEGDGVSLGGGTGDYAGGVKVTFIKNCTTPPTSPNPTGGGVLYAQAGALKWLGSSGTVTTLGAA